MKKGKGYVETQGPNGFRRVWTPEEYDAFLKKLDSHPDQHRAELLRRMLNPIYHEPEIG